MMVNAVFSKERQKLVFKYLDKYPDVASKQLARMIYNAAPGYFKDFEAARGYVRYYRGRSGVKSRKQITITKYFKDVQLT